MLIFLSLLADDNKIFEDDVKFENESELIKSSWEFSIENKGKFSIKIIFFILLIIFY